MKRNDEKKSGVEMTNPQKSLSRNGWVAIGIAVSISVLFAYTVHERSPWFGKMNKKMWVTGSTLLFSRNWYRDGALNDGFLMLEKPRSIETPDIASRSIYTSYPSGCLLPIHAMSLVTGAEPSLRMIMVYNLFIHVFVSTAFAFTAFLIAVRLRQSALVTYFFSMLPAVFYLLSPQTMAYHQNRYFADMAVMLPFAAVIFLETLTAMRNLTSRRKAIVTVVQHLFLALGLFTDYLFVFVYALLFLKRVFLKEMGTTAFVFLKRTALFSLSAIIPLGLFVFQVFHHNVFDALKDKYLFRTAADGKGAKYIHDFYAQFWERNVASSLGDIGIYLLFSSAFLIGFSILGIWILKLTRKIALPDTVSQILGIAAIVIYACFLQVYFLDNHSVIHDFSALKMAFTVALVPFSLLPLAVAATFPRIREFFTARDRGARVFSMVDARFFMPVLLIVAGLLFSLYISDIHPKFVKFIQKKPGGNETRIGKFLDQYTQYRDVVFSDTFEVGIFTHRILGLSMKQVHKVKSMKEIQKQMKKLPDDAVVNFFMEIKPDKKVPFDDESFWKKAKHHRRGNYVLFKMSRKRFLAAYKKRRLSPPT